MHAQPGLVTVLKVLPERTLGNAELMPQAACACALMRERAVCWADSRRVCIVLYALCISRAAALP
jgi:hypothetical protein